MGPSSLKQRVGCVQLSLLRLDPESEDCESSEPEPSQALALLLFCVSSSVLVDQLEEGEFLFHIVLLVVVSIIGGVKDTGKKKGVVSCLSP